MRILRNARLSVYALGTHRARTLLAVASTSIGVAAVLVLTAVGAGARGEVIRRIDSLGRNVLVVTATRVESRAGRRVEGSDWRRDLRLADAAALLYGSPAIRRVAPVHQRETFAKYGPLRTAVTVIGTTPVWRTMRQLELTRGRFFDEREAADHARVVVLGSEVTARLFADSLDPVGRTLRIGRVPFQIVGVLESRGVSVDGNATEDDRIFVPIETALRRLLGEEYVQMIYFEAADDASMSRAEREAAEILRARHRRSPSDTDNFVVQTQRTLLDAELAARTAFQRLTTGLGLLALLLGGGGVLSVMLLSLRERRKEIGLRIAVGARRRDILLQFLCEALLLAAAGGVLGLMTGAATAALVSSATRWEAAITIVPLAVATLATAAIGMTAGVLPAWRAATLDPIASLQAD